MAFLGPGAGAAALPLAFAPLVTVAGFVLGQGLVFLREKDLAFLSASASRDPLMLSFFFIGAPASSLSCCCRCSSAAVRSAPPVCSASFNSLSCSILSIRSSSCSLDICFPTVRWIWEREASSTSSAASMCCNNWIGNN